MTLIKHKSGMEVELIHHIGGDESVLRSMLVSTGTDYSETMPRTEKNIGRINALMREKHGTPFEHNQFCFRVKAPIFVYREFHRHRIGWSYNEESGRYKQLANEVYYPQADRPIVQVEGSKQMAYELEKGSPELRRFMIEEMSQAYEEAYAAYDRMLKAGVVKEVARMVLPVGIFSSMYATCNARSLMSFLSLRTREMFPVAQFPSKPMWEIDWIARQIEAIFAEHMPVTYRAYVDNRRVAP